MVFCLSKQQTEWGIGLIKVTELIEAKDLTSGAICFSDKRDKVGKWYERIFTFFQKKLTPGNTHISFIFPQENKIMCLEATMPKVQMSELKSALSLERNSRKIYLIKNWDLKDFKSMCYMLYNEFKDVKYGLMQAIFIPLARFFKVKNIFGLSKKKQVCSEFVLNGFLRSKYRELFIDLKKIEDKIIPQDIMDRIKAWLYFDNMELIERID